MNRKHTRDYANSVLLQFQMNALPGGPWSKPKMPAGLFVLRNWQSFLKLTRNDEGLEERRRSRRTVVEVHRMSDKSVVAKLLIIERSLWVLKQCVSHGIGSNPTVALHLYHHVAYENVSLLTQERWTGGGGGRGDHFLFLHTKANPLWLEK